MIEISQFEEVTQIKMSHEMNGRPLYWVAAYIVDGLLIDTGCEYTSEEFINCLQGKNIKLAVNTHHHEDHVGANHLVGQKFGIKIYAHPAAVPLISRVPRLNPYQELVWGYPRPSVVEPLSGTINTDNYTFEIIDTPGHCKDHIVLLEPGKGWCFSGDLFVSENQKVLRADEDINEIARSIERLLDIKTDRLILFTSIGRVVEDGREALRRYLDYLRELSRTAKRLDEEGMPVSAICTQICGRESSLAQLTGGHYSSENLIRSILCK
ncbi:MAG: MBL fold metallo-hydrolase [Bacillota bacterium]